MLLNKTKKRIIADKVQLCKNILSKTQGLMFKKKVENRALVFPFGREQYNPLHMMFVFYPIDVLFLDKEKKIVEIKENFKPFSYYSPRLKSKFVIELNNGEVNKKKVEVGDVIGW